MKEKCYKDIHQMKAEIKNIFKVIEVLEKYNIKLEHIAKHTLIDNVKSTKYYTLEYLVTLARNADILDKNLVLKLCKPYWTQGIIDNFIEKFKEGINSELLLSSCFINDETLEFALLEVDKSINRIDRNLNAIDNVYLNKLNLTEEQKCFLGIGLSFNELKFIKEIDNSYYLVKFIEGQINNTNFYDLKYFVEFNNGISNRIIGYFDNPKIALVRSLHTIEYELEEDRITSVFPTLNKKNTLIGSVELNICTTKNKNGCLLTINCIPENVTKISYLSV